MVYKITWSVLALETYKNNIEYLEKEWSEKEVKNFVNAVLRKLTALSLQPLSGGLTNKRASLRQVVIHKRIILIYRCKTLKREIELVRFFSTYQHPKRSRI